MAHWVLGMALVWGFAAFAAATPADSAPHGNWRLVWSDEFDYFGMPDPSKWEIVTDGSGGGNDEQEYYTNRLVNARVEFGYLVLEARKEDYLDHGYTSGMLHSKDSWKFGRIEARIKMPSGAGTWPAFWMLSAENKYSESNWPDNGEVDIAEHVGREPTQMLGCFYDLNFDWMNNNGITEITEIPSAETDFHIYAVEWDEDNVTLSIDGVQVNSFPNPHTDWQDWPFDQHYYLILNLAVGGGFAGDIDDSIFPQQLLVDYVRVYQPDGFISQR